MGRLPQGAVLKKCAKRPDGGQNENQNGSHMTDFLTAAQMRAVEKAAISSGEVTGLELMERAGKGVVGAIMEAWPEVTDGNRRAVVLCGPGNNGGDGFVVARLLKETGWSVRVYLYGDPERLPPDARANCKRWRELGEIATFPDERPDPWSSDVIIDAGFGTGLSRPLPDDLMAAFLGALPEADLKQAAEPPFVVAIDLPTGLCSDSGALLPAAVDADLTVTFHSRKLGHVLDRGPEFCGRVVVADIGLSDHVPGSVREIGGAPAVLAKSGGHKYGYGHALVVAGPPGAGGAARLAARGALRVGAGLVTLGCPIRAVDENAHHLNAIMLRSVDGAPGLREALEDQRFTSLCLGMGLGLGRGTHDLVFAALESGRPVVLDADALSRFQRSQEELFKRLHPKAVLTPHAGEFKRLFPDIAGKLDANATEGPTYSKVDATREAAARAGCTVLFKGPDTVIASPDGTCAINASVYERAAPWLATAGSGDVLAGFIAGLLARGVPPQKAAETGAWLHTECALSFGPGLISEDIPEELPKVLGALEG